MVLLTLCILIGVCLAQVSELEASDVHFIGCKFHIRRKRMQTSIELLLMTCLAKYGGAGGRGERTEGQIFAICFEMPQTIRKTDGFVGAGMDRYVVKRV